MNSITFLGCCFISILILFHFCCHCSVHYLLMSCLFTVTFSIACISTPPIYMIVCIFRFSWHHFWSEECNTLRSFWYGYIFSSIVHLLIVINLIRLFIQARHFSPEKLLAKYALSRVDPVMDIFEDNFGNASITILYIISSYLGHGRDSFEKFLLKDTLSKAIMDGRNLRSYLGPHEFHTKQDKKNLIEWTLGYINLQDENEETIIRESYRPVRLSIYTPFDSFDEMPSMKKTPFDSFDEIPGSLNNDFEKSHMSTISL